MVRRPEVKSMGRRPEVKSIDKSFVDVFLTTYLTGFIIALFTVLVYFPWRLRLSKGFTLLTILLTAIIMFSCACVDVCVLLVCICVLLSLLCLVFEREDVIFVMDWLNGREENSRIGHLEPLIGQ